MKNLEHMITESSDHLGLENSVKQAYDFAMLCIDNYQHAGKKRKHRMDCKKAIIAYREGQWNAFQAKNYMSKFIKNATIELKVLK